MTRIRLISMDVTGTLIAHKGHIGDYYCMAVTRTGNACPNYERVALGFKKAYHQISTQYPNFGYIASLDTKKQWKMVVNLSFKYAGYEYDEKTFEKIFLRIYNSFCSTSPYLIYEDVLPFLKQAKKSGKYLAVISNSDERYRLNILPKLNISKYFDEIILSKEVGNQKPSKEIFYKLLDSINNRYVNQKQGRNISSSFNSNFKADTNLIRPYECIHIGDSLIKDYNGAINAGFHSLLLNRYHDFDVLLNAGKYGYSRKPKSMSFKNNIENNFNDNNNCSPSHIHSDLSSCQKYIESKIEKMGVSISD